jgi:hypothetical protein
MAGSGETPGGRAKLVNMFEFVEAVSRMKNENGSAI